MAPVRLLGLALDAGADFRRSPGGKNAAFFAALDRRWPVVEVVCPELPRAALLAHRALRVAPGRGQWRRRHNLDPRLMRWRSAVAERELAAREGTFDVVVQLHTLVAPGTRPRPTLIHTDCTLALTLALDPAGVPLCRRERQLWLDQETAIYQGARWLLPRSAWAARSLIQDYGCDPSRVVVVGGGANFGPVAGVPGRYARQEALFVGLDFRRKGGLALLEAWPRVRRALPGAVLRVVGPPRPRGTLPDGVHWVGPEHDRAALARRYAEASLFVMPSLYEPWGHVFLEAQGCGLACVGATTCAMPEIVQEGVTGVLVPPGRADPLADALIGLLRDPVRLAVMGHAARARIVREGTWDHVAARLAPCVESAAAALPGAGAQQFT